MIKKVFMVCAALVFAFVSCSNDGDSPAYTNQQSGSTPPANYEITIETSGEGTIVTSNAKPKEGETVTLTITPKQGNVLVALGSLECEIEGSGNTRTLKMPNCYVRIKGAFRPAVTMGEWPQTIKAAAVTVDESVTETRGSLTYCKGSDDAWYAKQAENAYESGIKYSDGTAVGQGGTNYKYFKVEPIKWRVLSTNYGGKKLLMANQVLAVCAYYDTGEEDRANFHPNNYMMSKIRAFLNGLSYFKGNTPDMSFFNKGFLHAAFNSNEQASICDTEVDNTSLSTSCKGISPAKESVCQSTNDKLFLLSVREAVNADYGFPENFDDYSRDSARILQSSDYAKACGVYCRTNGNATWQLRSPAEFSSKCSGVRICSPEGKIYAGSLGSRGANAVGVAPALCVNN